MGFDILTIIFVVAFLTGIIFSLRAIFPVWEKERLPRIVFGSCIAIIVALLIVNFSTLRKEEKNLQIKTLTSESITFYDVNGREKEVKTKDFKWLNFFIKFGKRLELKYFYKGGKVLFVKKYIQEELEVIF